MNRTVSTSAIVFGLLLAGNVQAASASKEQLYNGQSIHGRTVSQVANARVVDVSAQKSLNVDCGETVTFKKGSQTFTWKFESASHRVVDLRAIAPAGFSDASLMVYVSRNEAERS
jgi:hypothetical protein